MVKQAKDKIEEVRESLQDKHAKDAQKQFMQELFNDYYMNRRQVYKMNFVRGLFFGLGSVLGGTVVIALTVWLLSFFVDFPLIGEYFQRTQDALEQGR